MEAVYQNGHLYQVGETWYNSCWAAILICIALMALCVLEANKHTGKTSHCPRSAITIENRLNYHQARRGERKKVGKNEGPTKATANSKTDPALENKGA